MSDKVLVYKKIYNTKADYVAVGQVDDEGNLEFAIPVRDLQKCEIPHNFYPEFYKDIEVKRETYQEVFNESGEKVNNWFGSLVVGIVRRDFEPKFPVTEMLNINNSGDCNVVTGYVTDDGIAVYYSQYVY